MSKASDYFHVVFNRDTLELVAVEPYRTLEEAVPAFSRNWAVRTVEAVIEAESEESLHARYDLEEIARELRDLRDRGEASLRRFDAAVARLPYAERRVSDGGFRVFDYSRDVTIVAIHFWLET
jgi:hypothetical protein